MLRIASNKGESVMSESEGSMEPGTSSASGKILAAFLIGAGVTAATVLIMKRVRANGGFSGSVFDRCDRAANELERRLGSVSISLAS